jgi:hypothetical protein
MFINIFNLFRSTDTFLLNSFKNEKAYWFKCFSIPLIAFTEKEI